MDLYVSGSQEFNRPYYNLSSEVLINSIELDDSNKKIFSLDTPLKEVNWKPIFLNREKDAILPKIEKNTALLGTITSFLSIPYHFI